MQTLQKPADKDTAYTTQKLATPETPRKPKKSETQEIPKHSHALTHTYTVIIHMNFVMVSCKVLKPNCLV